MNVTLVTFRSEALTREPDFACPPHVYDAHYHPGSSHELFS